MIDKEYLDDGYCRKIVSGLIKLMKKSDDTRTNILILGGGGYCLSKFLYENLIPQPRVLTV